MKNIKNLLSTVACYNNTPAWKLDENGSLVLKEGNPVYVDSSGQERTVGINTISNLNNEAKTHREAKEAAEARLKAFGDLDPVKAREALETVSKIDQKTLIDAGKVDEVRNQVTQQYQQKLDATEMKLKELQGMYDSSMVKNLFANSEFIRNNVAVPRDMFEASFSKNFKVVEGQVVAYDNKGDRLYSSERAGEYATPEEALRILAEAHPEKDNILRANVGNGSGSSGSGGNGGGSRTIKRSEFEKLPTNKKIEVSAKVRAGEMKLTD